jgi:cell division protein FtsL
MTNSIEKTIMITLFVICFFLGLSDAYFLIKVKDHQKEIKQLREQNHDLKNQVNNLVEDVSNNKIQIWQLIQRHLGVVDIVTEGDTIPEIGKE